MWALDAAAAAGYTALALTFALHRPVAAGAAQWTAWVLVPAVGLPLALRRLWPVPVFSLVLAMSLVAWVRGLLPDPFLAAAFALYTVAATQLRPPREPALAIAGAGAVVLFGSLVFGLPAGGLQAEGVLLTGAGALAGAWMVGRAVRAQRAYVARSAAHLAERAVTAERLRIARELHDVLAHSMSLIAVKASVARHVLELRPEEAGPALGVIETASRGALAEMRALLGVLRADAGEEEPSAGLAPAPGAAALPALRQRVAETGLRVEMALRGVQGLPAGLDLTVYRIVQEALTNVLRHAAATECRVTAVAAGGAIDIRVTDDGRGGAHPAPTGGTGHGLVGMRERVAMYGGTFTAGPRAGGGFEVCARLPHAPADPVPPGAER